MGISWGSLESCRGGTCTVTSERTGPHITEVHGSLLVQHTQKACQLSEGGLRNHSTLPPAFFPTFSFISTNLCCCFFLFPSIPSSFPSANSRTRGPREMGTGGPLISENGDSGIVGRLRIQQAEVWGEPDTGYKETDDSYLDSYSPTESGPKCERKEKPVSSFPLLYY